ncbi:MAG: diguanylate cyclase domain-containing protein [Sulfuricaulis sp.]
MVKSAQHQIEILVGRNFSLKHELTVLAQKEAQARYLAYHDGLTGLPNRNLLQDRFNQAISLAERHHKPLALIMLDLDDFKRVNDQLGHVSGDKLLQAVALRLTKDIRSADTACRYGGDEFVIMLPVIDNPGIASALAMKIGVRLCEPYHIDGHEIHMACSIGIAVYPGNGQTFEELIKQADVAMYSTKGTGTITRIVEQPKQDIGKDALHQPPPQKIDRERARDLFIHDVLAHDQSGKKHYPQL